MGRQMVHGMVVDGHLGGYVPGGDPNTTYPLLWRYLVDELGVRSVLDIGCGDGGAARWFIDEGCTVRGVDGIDQSLAYVQQHDYSVDGERTPISYDPPEFDLVWSAEFVEHVEATHVPDFLADFALGKVVLMTHAVPGQPGWHHVNCRTSDYWIGAMAAIGYELDVGLMHVTRDLAERESGIPSQGNYYAATGLAFRRVEPGR